MEERIEGFWVMRTPLYADGLKDLIDWVGTYTPTSELRMIEIGSYVGESTTIFAQNFKEVVSVDPYVDNYDPNDVTCRCWPLDVVYNEFLLNSLPYPNIRNIRLSSNDAVGPLNRSTWDFVYIDGIHTYEAVSNDIDNYRGMIKPGGFIAGHDYGIPGVKQAVDERLTVIQTFKDTSWIARID